MKLSNPNFVGWTLIASGVWWILQLIFLSLLYTVGQPWGSLSDFSSALMVLFMLPFVLALYNLFRADAQALSLITLIIGVVGILTAATGSVLILIGRINFLQSLPPVLGGQVAIGVWFMISLWMAKSRGVLPSKTAIWGMVIWLGLASVAVLMLSSATQFAGGDWGALLPSPLVYPIILLGLIGLLGYPFWAFGVGRLLLSSKIVLS